MNEENLNKTTERMKCDDIDKLQPFNTKKFMIIVSVLNLCTGISIIGHSLLTLYYLNNKKIYEAFLRIENKSSNGSWLSEQAIKDAINISDIDKQEGVKYLTLYMFCGFVLIIVSILAYQIRKKSGNWKIDLNLYHLYEALGNVVTPGGIILWILIIKSDGLKNFIYLPNNVFVFVLALGLNSINFILKLITLRMSFNDYFETVVSTRSEKEE